VGRNVWLDLAATIWKQCSEISMKVIDEPLLKSVLNNPQGSSQTAAPPHR
jgi:hypothetical protein